MKVKICGFTTAEPAVQAEAAGADYLGFIFAEGKRCITFRQAEAIIGRLGGRAGTVGVFMDQPLEEINSTVHMLGLDFVQLHGNEPPELAEAISVPVIKALTVRTKADYAKAADYPAAYLLIDRPKTGRAGILDLGDAARFIEQSGKPVILAGGLTPENIAGAVQAVKPYGVDVAGGVETDGMKDSGKISRFIRLAKFGEE